MTYCEAREGIYLQEEDLHASSHLAAGDSCSARKFCAVAEPVWQMKMKSQLLDYSLKLFL